MSGFRTNAEGDLDRVFFTEYELIDRYTSSNLWSVGASTTGALGDGTTVNKSSPVQPAGRGVIWKLVSAGGFHSGGVKSDGTLWTWGRNQTAASAANGQLGDGTTVNKLSPVTTSGGGTNWTQVSCGYLHTAAVKTDGTLWNWGNGGSGRLGNNSTANASSPVTPVGGGTNWKMVATGNAHTIAIKTDGTLWVWGSNTYGELGTGNTTNTSSPVTTTGGGTTWKYVAAGNDHSSAIKFDGTLWTWGRNPNGQIGDGTTVNRSSPNGVVNGGTTWKLVAGNSTNTAAVKTDGTLWTWGGNAGGQLGDGTTLSKSSPVQVTGNLNWNIVNVGGSHTAGIAT